MNDLHGRKFGELTVIGVYEIKRYKSEHNKQTKVYWLCDCSCGQTKIVRGEHLISGRTISCGCKAKDNAVKHGSARRHKYTPEYRSWLNMRRRLNDPAKAKYYGDVGMAEKWDSFISFLSDMGRKPTPTHELDRIDPFLPYCKENCRWATRKEQMQNTRKQYILSRDGGNFGIEPTAK